MPNLLSHRWRCTAWARLLLVALLLRAYVPVGFMPASGTPFLLELCPAAAPMPMPMSASMPGHHHHSGAHSQFDQCPFGSAPAAGPLSQEFAWVPPARIESETAAPRQPIPFSTSLPRAHQPRGPPPLV